MTIDEFVKYAHDHNYVIKTQESENQALCIMNAYEKIRNDYDTRLKADLVAMLTEIQLEIDELRAKKHFQYKHGQEHGLNDALELIQEKINALKEKTDGTDNGT